MAVSWRCVQNLQRQRRTITLNKPPIQLRAGSSAESASRGTLVDAFQEERPLMADVGLTHIALPVTNLDTSISFYEKYAQSKHFQHLVNSEDGMAEQGPNCVTCHGSVSPTVPTGGWLKTTLGMSS